MAGRARRWLLLLLLIPGAAGGQETPEEPGTTVNGVLFYSPTCPHCREVMTQTLPPIIQRYGDRLRIVSINTATAGGEQLFRAAIESLAIPRQRIGVPTLIVGSRVLVGAHEIPTLLPGIVDGADQDVDWPHVPLIRRALAAQGIATQPEPVTPAPGPAPVEAGDRDPAPQDSAAEPSTEPAAALPPGPAGIELPGLEGADRELAGAVEADPQAALGHELTVRERLMLDPTGNGFAIAVLLFMLAVLFLVAADAGGWLKVPVAPGWAVPALSVVGMGVAAYLAFVEVTGAEAVCGPVGDCNTVQQSPYATVFGVPVGLLGLLGYAALLATWSLGRLRSSYGARLARTATWWMALVATGFSMYLTFLEPFVIGATCAWCLTSAVATTLILLAATADRRVALASGTNQETGSRAEARP